MKKYLSVSVYIIAFLNLFLPICETIARLFGLQFSFFNYFVTAVICFALPFVNAVCSFFSEKDITLRNFERILYSYLPVISVLNFIFFVIKTDSLLVLAFTLLNLIILLYLAKKLGKRLAFRISLISSVPFALLAALVIILRPMLSWAAGESTVLEKHNSPDGEYYVELVERDMGATGGEREVMLYEKGFNAFVFSFTKPGEKLYTGGWQEEISIEWLDDDTLIINGESYEIN